MGNEMAPEFIVDQGVYYPAANYYGYYPTGYESPGEWDDHNRFLGLDGQDVHYSGLQTESLPYAYYTPSYGYAQSPYNPYNPYIPGAVIGLDGPYVGTQQYYTNPPYQQTAYIPVVVQPGTDAVPNSTLDPSLFGTSASMSSAHVNPGVKYTAPLPSNFVAANSQRSASGNLTSETSQSFHTTAKTSEGSLVNLPPSKQSSLQGAMPLGSAAHVPQNPLKVTIPSNDGISHFGSNVRGWAPVDKFRPRLQINGVVNNPTGGTDILCEQNRGPRTSRSKGQWTSAIVDGGYASKVSASNAQRSILINADQYNKDDFPVTYPNAKFFVIKSYSEDDVHKSIKYNVWSSTPNGNKKLDSAYEDAQRISVGKQRNCPIFLFFSVNASGQFCGVSEMIGPVDFHKDMNFWQQDKWTGSFPVKWHIIKDVPNTSFRHIILENNENKPVTNSRDTQEILYLPGINMLNIFKNSPLKTSILDDFMFYEERERIMQEEKFRLLGRSYDSSQFLPAIVPVNRTDVTVVQPSKADEEQSSPELNDPPKAAEKLVCGASHQPPKADGKKSDGLIDQPTKTNGKRANGTVDQPPKAPSNGVVDQAPKGDGKLVCGASHQSPKADGKKSDGLVGQPTKSDGKQANRTVDQSPKADGKPPNGAVDQPPKGDGKSSNGGAVDQAPMSGGKPVNGTVDEPLKADTIATKPNDPKKTGDHPPMTGRSPSKPKEPRSTADRPLKADRKDPTSTSDQHPRADKNPGKPRDLKNTGKARTSDEPAARKLNSIKPAEDKNNTKPNLTGDTSAANSVAIDPKEGESTDVVTVGSMRIRVSGRGESSSSSIITVGATIPTEPPKGLKHKKQVALAGSRPPQK